VSEGWWPGPESNQRHPHFQCGALPTELPGPQECIPKDLQKPEYNMRKLAAFADTVSVSSQRARTMRAALSARGVLTIAAQLGLVARLSAVIAAVLSVRPLRFDHALTGGVCALGSSGHKRTSAPTLRPTEIR
jgi:hypothetical protein